MLRLKNLQRKINFYDSEIEKKSEKISIIDSEIKTKEHELVALDQSLMTLKNTDFKNLKKLVGEIKEEKNKVSDERFELSKDLAIAESELKEIMKKIEKNIELKKEIKSLNEKIVVLEHLYKYLGKSGIQVILINSLVEDLESHTNKVLNDICNEPIQISLDTQKLRSDKISQVETLDLNTIKDGYKYDFKSLSGGKV